MSTFTNTAREVEMPNGDIVKLHDGVTPNSTSNIKKFKYDDNGHVTESTAADAEDLNLSGYSTPTTGTTDIGASDDVQTAIGKLDHQSHIDQTNILYSLKVGANNLSPVDNVIFTRLTEAAYTDPISINLTTGDYIIRYKLTTTVNAAVAITYDGSEHTFYDSGAPYSDTVITHNFTVTNSGTSFRFYFNQTATVSELMIVPKEVWDTVGHDFTPPALPNSDLTYLEAEDRAALINLINTNNKNLFDCSIPFDLNSYATITNNLDGSYKITGGGSSSVMTPRHFLYLPYAGTYILSGCPDGGSDNGYSLEVRNTNDTVVRRSYGGKSEFTVSSGGNYLVDIRFGANYTAPSEGLMFYPMVCFKSLSTISDKFVPSVPKSQTKEVGACDFNTLKSTGTYYIRNVTKATHHAPKDGCYFASIYAEPTGDVWQKAYRINEPQYVYQRQYNGGNWGSWYVFTGTVVS